MMGLPSLVNEL